MSFASFASSSSSSLSSSSSSSSSSSLCLPDIRFPDCSATLLYAAYKYLVFTLPTLFIHNYHLYIYILIYLPSSLFLYILTLFILNFIIYKMVDN